MSSRGPLRPLFFTDSIICLNFFNFYNIGNEDYRMIMLTIDGLKYALNYIQNNKSIKYHEFGPKKGLISIPEGTLDDEAYHLRVIQLLEPKLLSRLADEYTVLSLDGQELLDVLSDDVYLLSLTAQLKRRGYSSPSDRQVFRLLREKMAGDDNKSWPDVMKSLLVDAVDARNNGNERIVLDTEPSLPPASAPELTVPEPEAQAERIEEVSADPEPQASKLIKAAKQSARQSTEA
jgi:hypothetical protein